jgi:hypothetical protein
VVHHDKMTRVVFQINNYLRRGYSLIKILRI